MRSKAFDEDIAREAFRLAAAKLSVTDHFRDPDGALMELKQLRQKSADELKAHLLDLHKEQFSLRMQKATGQLRQDPRHHAVCAARSLA